MLLLGCLCLLGWEWRGGVRCGGGVVEVAQGKEEDFNQCCVHARFVSVFAHPSQFVTSFPLLCNAIVLSSYPLLCSVIFTLVIFPCCVMLTSSGAY